MSPLLSFDLETHLIQPGLLAPPIVCYSAAWREDGHTRTRLDKEQFFEFEAGKTYVGANIAYDFGCILAAKPHLLPSVWKLYEEGRVFDVQIAATLNAIAEGRLREGELFRQDGSKVQKGRYSLEECVLEWLGRRDAKANDRWRLSYALLENLPLEQWPLDARQYPIDDAVNTLLVAEAQLRSAKNLVDQSTQAWAAFCTHLGAMWGLRTDAQAVDALEAQVKARIAELEAWALSEGLMRPKTKKPDSPLSVHKKAVEERVMKAYLGAPPHTEKGGISTARETLEDSGDPVLEKFIEVNRQRKFQTYIPSLREASVVPLNVKPNILLSTGRVSYEGVIQLMPRKGGIRECFKAREGYVWSSVDYSAIEMSTLAQVCLWHLGYSNLAEAINEGKDVHSILGGNLSNLTYEEFYKRRKGDLKDVRQGAKIGNFGYPGMMGAAKFVSAQRKQDTRVCELFYADGRCSEERVIEWNEKPLDAPVCKRCMEKAQEIREGFISTWKEIRPYWQKVSNILKNEDAIVQFVSKRVRGKPSAPAAANSYFQGLAADGAKRAVIALTREMYLDTQSPLYGSRLVNFAHDETILEIPEEKAHDAAMRQATVMVEEMRKVVPDVKVSAEPALMKIWFKGAEAVYKDGKLAPWTP